MRKVADRPARRAAPPRRAASAATAATNRTIGMNDRLYAYLVEQTLREPEIIKRLRAKTSRLPRGTMQISPEQGQLMGLLVRLIGARRHSTARSLRLGLATAISPEATRRQRTA